MRYKQMDNNFSFTDLSLLGSMERNYAISHMGKINTIINWASVENLLPKHYTIGKNIEGTAAYPHLHFAQMLSGSAMVSYLFQSRTGNSNQ